MKIPFTNVHVYSPGDDRNAADRRRRAAAPAQQPIVMATSPAPRRRLGFAFGPKLPPANAAPPFDINRLANAGIVDRVGEILANDGANRSLANLQQTCWGMLPHVFETLQRQRIQELILYTRTPAQANIVLDQIEALYPGDQPRPLALLMLRITNLPELFDHTARTGLMMSIDQRAITLGNEHLRQRFVLGVLRQAEATGQQVTQELAHSLLWTIRSLTPQRRAESLEALFNLQTARPGAWVGNGILNDIEALPLGIANSVKEQVTAYRQQQASTS
jgi:hypothetical protein